jgi:hypothetical protein
MSSRVMVGIAALLVYLGVSVGCILSAPGANGASGIARDGPLRVMAERTAGLPMRGVAMQLHRVDLADLKHKEGYARMVDEVVNLGADTVKFVVNAQMENGKSSRIYMDLRATPDQEQLVELIKYAKGKGLRVVLMPIVLLEYPEGDEWRGKIQPKNPTLWWDHYRQMMYHYAMAAERGGVDLLVIGSELVSMENKLDEWIKVITTVRGVYKGMLTYSSNWDHYKDIPFWDYLDVIGMNSYWKLGDDGNVPVAEVVRRWQGIQKNVLGFAKSKGKPLILLEVGWCSQANAPYEPWDYTKDEVPIDLDVQKRLWQAFFQAWHGTEGFGGFMLWEWTPGDGGPKERGYTPEGKPAEAVIREWLAKPGWKVQ